MARGLKSDAQDRAVWRLSCKNRPIPLRGKNKPGSRKTKFIVNTTGTNWLMMMMILTALLDKKKYVRFCTPMAKLQKADLLDCNYSCEIGIMRKQITTLF